MKPWREAVVMKNLNELESELKAIELQLQQAKSDHDLENSLNKRKGDLENEIRKLKMFVMYKRVSRLTLRKIFKAIAVTPYSDLVKIEKIKEKKTYDNHLGSYQKA